MIRKRMLKYLGYGNGQEPSGEIKKLLEECLEEVKKEACPKAVVRKFHLDHDPLCLRETGVEIAGKQIGELLDGCEECLLIGCTLGISIERTIRRMEKINMTKAVAMDAAASAYLECFCDDYEGKLGIADRTFRACPGYGDFPLEFNQKIPKLLDIPKTLGAAVTASDLLIPQKTMLGIIGIGTTGQKRSCAACVRRKSCSFRKRGERCYEID